MVSIWMLCASRTPGSERHKALQAGPRPRAPRGPPARPQRQTLSAALAPGPARPQSLLLGTLSCRGRTQQPGRVDRSLSPAEESSYRAKSRGPAGSAQLIRLKVHHSCALSGVWRPPAAEAPGGGKRLGKRTLGTLFSLQFRKGRLLEASGLSALLIAEP